MLQVTPNGPFGKDRHPHVPVGLDELLADLRECFVAGANGVHLHVRDGTGAETLDPAWVNLVAKRWGRSATHRVCHSSPRRPNLAAYQKGAHARTLSAPGTTST